MSSLIWVQTICKSYQQTTVKNINIFHPLFFDKMLFIRTEGHKILVRITNREYPDQTVSLLAAMFLQKVK